MDLPLSGGSFTWSNNTSWSRIDAFIVSLDCEAKYLGLFQKGVLRLCFDNFPILPDCGGIQGGAKDRFKFENMLWVSLVVALSLLVLGSTSSSPCSFLFFLFFCFFVLFVYFMYAWGRLRFF
jgi:hypothetical protein